MKRALLLMIMVSFLVLMRPVKAEAETIETAGLCAYILIESGTGTVLEEYNSHERRNPGYLTKLMSLLLVAEDIETGKYSLETELTASQSVYGTKGSVVWLEPGDKMTVEELLKSVIIGNANDAMKVLAEASEFTEENFVKRMNSETFDLGLRDTAFYSACGYADEREYTTAADMAVICSHLAKYGFLKPYFQTWRDFVKEGRTELVSENTLSRTYKRHGGFKACHSELAGYCAAEYGESSGTAGYIAVVLGADDEDISLKSARKLIDHGFADYKVTATMFPDEMMRPVTVRRGEEPAVEIKIKNQSRIVIPRGVSELSTVVVLPEYLTAPLKKGQRIGTAAFYNEKNLVCETDIITAEEVKRTTYRYIFEKTIVELFK